MGLAPVGGITLLDVEGCIAKCEALKPLFTALINEPLRPHPWLLWKK